MTCGKRPKQSGRHRCAWCALMVAPIDEQVEAARARRGFVPDEIAPARIAKGLWPDGYRYCSGCRSFVPSEYVAASASRCRACSSAATHAARIEKVYGLSSTEYDRLLAFQNGRCAICRGRPRSKRLAVDHDHATGAVRGLLCSRCNNEALGSLHDSVQLAWNAYHYLSAPPASRRDVADWEAALTASRANAAAPVSAPKPLGIVAQHGAQPRSGARPALEAAVARSRETAATVYAPLASYYAELAAARKSGDAAALLAALDAMEARGLIDPPPF